MDTSQLTLWKLEVFCQVLESQSFSRAARVLGVSQPTVSGHVSDLERGFGVRLFDRSSGDILATRAGELLFEQARQLKMLKQDTIRAMQNLVGVVEGDIAIGGSTIPGTYLLPRYLAAFKTEYPKIHMTLRIGDSSEIVGHVLAGEVELGVVGGGAKGQHLKTQEFVEDELVAILPPGSPLAARETLDLAALATAPMLIRERGSGTRDLIEQGFAAAGGPSFDDLDIVCELGSSESVKEAVRQGLGLSLISRIACAAETEIAVRPVEGVDLRRKFQIISHEKRTLSPIARALIEKLKLPVAELPTP